MSDQRKGYYGGRVEYSRSTSGRAALLSYAVFVLTFSMFIYWMWREIWQMASVMLIASGMMLTWAIARHRSYRAEKRAKKVFYYDIMSPYPASMRKGVECPFLVVIDSCDCDASSQSIKKKEKLSGDKS